AKPIIPGAAARTVRPGYADPGPGRGAAAREVITDTARRLGRVLNIAQGVAPYAQNVVDVLFPETLVGIRDAAVGLCVIIGAAGDVVGDLVVIQDIAGPQRRRKWIRPVR